MKEVIICRCEEITEGEINEAIKNGAGTVKEIKRWTRAGMGLCQGKTCRRLVEGMIVRETRRGPGELDPPSHRIPVRPIKTDVFRETREEIL